jgi:hypothetical protein
MTLGQWVILGAGGGTSVFLVVCLVIVIWKSWKGPTT